MTSEIEDELTENVKKIEVLIDKQKFTVGDAHAFLARYFNFIRKIQDLEESRDKWKKKYMDLKMENGY
jgi:DNA polymerase IIIc chi subunit